MAEGINMNTQVCEEAKFGAAISLGMDLVHDRIVRPWLLIRGLYALSDYSRKANTVVKDLNSFTEKIIRNKFAEFQSGKLSPAYVTSGEKRIVPFSDMLIESSDNVLSYEEIQDEVTTIAASGLETTATIMSCLIVLVAIHPHVQRQIHSELLGVFGSDDRAATNEDINKMAYMKQVIKETLRMFPAVTFLPREISEDVKLASGYTLPAGCSAFVLSYLTHRSPDHWPDPDTFNPDRWCPDSATQRHPYAYIPFSAGPRNCVGQKYAMLQMASVLSGVFRRYHVTTRTTLEDMKEIRVSMTSRPVIGYNIRLQRRRIGDVE